MKNINELLNEMTVAELNGVEVLIKDLKTKKAGTVIIELDYNSYKGSGKAWVAKVDAQTKKVLTFVDAETNITDGTYKGTKVFKLQEGEHYLLNSVGSKSSDTKDYVVIQDGEQIEF